MTVASAVDRVDYTGNGSVSSYSYTFYILESSDILVITRDTSGTETELTLTTDYTVTGAGTPSGGTVALVNGPLTSGYHITIKRNPDVTQETALAGQRRFFASSVEAGLDRLAMICQMQQDAINRALRLPGSEDGDDFTTAFPTATLRANKVVYFDSNGDLAVASGAAIGVGGFTSTRVPFANGAGLLTESASFVWDDTNKALSIGTGLARFHTYGDHSMFFGVTAGNFTYTGNGFSTSFGYETLKALTASANVAGFKLAAFGYQTLTANTTGWNNSAFGYNSMLSNTTGSSNAAYGFESLRSNTTGIKNTAVGEDVMYFNTTGNYNVAIGVVALYHNTSGESNVAAGLNAAYGNTTGFYNVAIGENALFTSTAYNGNTAVGYKALYTSDGGVECVAVGYLALFANTTGNYSVAIGSNALTAATNGAQNTAVGFTALGQITTASQNVAVGYGSGQNGGTPMTTTANSVFIGHSANCSVNALSNVIAIGYQAQATASNSMVCGNSSLTVVRPTSASSGVATCDLGNATHPWLTLTVGSSPPTAGTVRIGNDGDDGAGSTGAVWKRAAATAREWSWFINSAGSFLLRDRTGANNCLQIDTAGDLKIINKVGFYNTAPVAKQTRGATFTNNITAGGTTDSPANWTDLTTYATDAAAIRNFCYQVARVLVQYDTAFRAYGLLT